MQHYVDRLPSKPDVLLKLIEACQRVDISFDELADIIKLDAALSCKILSAAYSSTSTRWREVKDFNQLLLELGLGAIKTIGLSSVVHQFFSQPPAPEQADFLEKFWRNSLCCAFTAQALANQTGYPAINEAYLAGLLHNVGQLTLYVAAPTEYAASQQAEITANRQQQENALFGTTSIETTAAIIDSWGINSFMGDSALYQNEPVETLLDTPHLIKLINLANKLSESSVPDDKLIEEANCLFQLTQPQLEELLTERDQQLQAALSLPGKSPSVIDEASDSSDQVELALARQVRNISILGSFRQHLCKDNDLGQTLQSIAQDLNILFGLSKCLCYLYHSEANQLTIAQCSLPGTQKLKEFKIPLIAERSIVANSLLQRRPVSSEISKKQVSVIDHQIHKLLGEEILFCIPLIVAEENIGVLVTGIDQHASQRLHIQQDLILQFANEAAQTIQQHLRQQYEKQQLVETERERLLKHTKKLLHEANNPLGIINNYLQILSARQENDPVTQSQVAILKEEIERVTGILLRMKDLPRSEALPKGEVDLNSLIRDLASIFKASLFATHNIKEQLNLDESLPPLLSNKNSLKQILTNLIKNAVEAMPEGGSITIGTRNQVNIDGDLYIELSVTDNGPGIPDQILKQLFNPITSSKPSGHSGLGLTIVKKLVTDMHGSIRCRSISGDGTEFLINLPLNTNKEL